jgi:hypothetical protein
LDVKTLSGKNIITEIDNFVNKTLRVKFPKEVEKILNENLDAISTEIIFNF